MYKPHINGLILIVTSHYRARPHINDRILGAIRSSALEMSLNVFLCLISISLMINKDHLSPTVIIALLQLYNS